MGLSNHARYIYLAGGDVGAVRKNIPDPVKFPRVKNIPVELLDIITTPQSLVCMCRSAIRQQVTHSRLGNLSQLEGQLPETVLRYLQLSDIDEL